MDWSFSKCYRFYRVNCKHGPLRAGIKAILLRWL
jgi:hypothetical protein